MKRKLFTFALAVLTVGLLGSCSKINERLDNLEKKVSGIENEQIASINSQISGITSSISDLGQIRSDISSLKQSASDHSVDIFNLEEADRALKDRILNLEDYVDAVLPNYAEKEWVEATFSTLEQYEATCDTIAKIDARIGALDAKLSKDIKACADSLTKWVNKQFEGYYTAAQMDAKLTQMKSAIDSSKASGKISDAKVDSIAAELAKTKTAVDTAKANIRKEYRAAIDTAIKTSEGKLTKALQDAIATVNGKIESLTTKVGKLETSVADLKGRVDKLEEMIQSVVIVPAYSDGSVEVKDDTLSIDFAVTPKDAMSELSKTDVKILLNKVQTKAVVLDTVPTDSIKVFTKEMKSGAVSLKALIKENLEKLGNNCSLTVAVNVRNGISNYTTEFVPVTVAAAKPTVEYVEIGGLKWATMNLGAEKVTDYGDYFAWGETAPYYVGTGGWPATPTWKTGKESGYAWQSYCGSSSFSEWSTPPYDATTKILKPEFDAAAQTLGDGWRMPTTAEFKALYDACGGTETPKTGGSTSTTEKGVYWCTNYDGVAGCLFCDGTNKLFFPAAGRASGTSTTGSNCHYWSSSLNAASDKADYLFFDSQNSKPQSSMYRFYGRPIRPVKAAAAPLPAGALKGEFSVSADKKVHFSQGNLYYDGSKFDFEANQYEFHGYDSANNTWGLFGWVGASSTAFTSSPAIYGASTSTTSADYGNSATDALKADWGTAIDDKGIWRTLSTAEWQYLFKTDAPNRMVNGKPCYSNAMSGVTIGGATYKGIFLYPDDYSGKEVGDNTETWTWDKINSAGIVFLPAAGRRNGSQVYYVGEAGFYLSSTANDEDHGDCRVYRVYFDINGVYHELAYREYGFSVRLVTEVK